MEIKFTGTGGAFDYQQGNSSALVKLRDKTVLLDCGHSVYPRLRVLGIENTFDHILITHFHDDHVGSLSALILYRKMISGKKLTVIYPDENFKRQLIDFLNFSLRKPADYVRFEHINKHENVFHIDTFGKHVPEMQTYAYYFSERNSIIAYSGDLGDGDLLYRHFRDMADDHELTVFHEVSFNKNVPPHTHYTELEKYAEIGKTYAYHCNPSDKPDDFHIPLVAETPHLIYQ